MFVRCHIAPSETSRPRPKNLLSFDLLLRALMRSSHRTGILEIIKMVSCPEYGQDVVTAVSPVPRRPELRRRRLRRTLDLCLILALGKVCL